MSELHDIAEARRRRAKATKRTQQSATGLPSIEVSERHLRDLSADAMRALQPAAGATPVLYRQGSEIVRPVAGRAEVELVTVPAMRGVLDRAADWVSTDKDTGARRPRRPPLDVVQDLLALPANAFPLPPLHGVTAAPLFLAGGRLLVRDGYDADSGYLVCLDGLRGVRADMPPTDALALLREDLLGDFPFASAGAKAHALAMLLQPFVRPMIAGPTPLFVLDAPAAGTGKGLLIAVVSLVAQGAEVPVGAMIPDETETEKRITSILLSGASFVLLDEAHELNSPALAAALTADVWRGRRLGKSQTVSVPNHALWAATANNVRLGGDISRRVIPIRLDAEVERPETRTSFRHPELKLWAQHHRRDLVTACLSLIQAWIDAGMPPSPKTLGSYEAWAATLGGILTAAGVTDFLAGCEYLHGEADDEAKDWAGLLVKWRQEFADQAVTAAPVMALARRLGLLPAMWAGRSTLSAQQRTGHALQKVRDRVFSGLRVRYAGPAPDTRNASYRVEAVLSPRPGDANKHPQTPANTRSGSRPRRPGWVFAGCCGVGGPKRPDPDGRCSSPTRPPNTPETPGGNRFCPIASGCFGCFGRFGRAAGATTGRRWTEAHREARAGTPRQSCRGRARWVTVRRFVPATLCGCLVAAPRPATCMRRSSRDATQIYRAGVSRSARTSARTTS